ncbi:hypothetical protein PG985_009866 [Apiospora marii]|uniref:uncharacterized protein n=1 Tax=Apiospora marii TaxID=335849 RepID=UPI00313217B8
MGNARAFWALPFLLIATWAWREMDLDSVVSTAKPSAESGFIEWDGGDGNDKYRLAILDDFHGVEFLDRFWRGATATFSVSAFGYDSIAAWQTFHFLVDLGPLYAIWLLESHRAANAWSPAYFPTIFTLASQALGAGIAMPFFYILCVVFSPSASELARAPPSRRTVWSRGSLLLILLVFVLHTAEVFAMFLAPSYEARHYWTWAWQMVPLWIGVGNVVADQVLKLLLGRARISSTWTTTVPKAMLAVMALVSTVVWVYTILFSPHPLAVLFTPAPDPQDGLILRSRKAFQADEIALFGCSFLWLVYSFVDLHLAGFVGLKGLLYNLASLPVATAVLGPGSTFALSWYARERMLGSS